MTKKARVTCPQCGEAGGVPIIWGLTRADDDLEREDVVFGGCVVPAEPVDTHCQECGYSWQRVPVPLQWPDPRGHADGEVVEVAGTVCRVVLEATREGRVWADFELVLDERLPRLRCLAFPTTFAALDVALEPGLEVRLRGRMSQSQGPELHVTEWTSVGG